MVHYPLDKLLGHMVVYHLTGELSDKMLRIPARVRYAAKAMLNLAMRYGQGPILLREVAEREHVSESYLENLMVPLKTARLVRATRGAGGGYSLSRPPAEISLNEIVSALEGPLALVECIDNPKLCYRSDFCVTRDIWTDIERSVTAILESKTLADMVREQNERGNDLVEASPGPKETK